MRVIFTHHARVQLKEIYQYYKDKGLGKIGRQIRVKILQKAMKLKDFPYLGQKELNLEEENFEYRFLVEGNYKIIYRVIKEDKKVLINDIFDTRQDPDKI